MTRTRAMTFDVGGSQIAVTVRDRAALDAQLRERMRRDEGYALATINLDHLVKLRRDAAFREAYAAHDLVTADGNPIVWLGRMAGHDLSLVTGSDAIVPMCRLAAQLDVNVGFVGSTEDVLKKAKAFLRGEVPGLRIAFTEAPPMGFDPEGEAATDILARAADAGVGLLFVALGAPKQERFAAHGRRMQPRMGFASIGAGLDFFAGTQKRAPAWMRRFALEWVWRMMRDPRRLAMRYVACAAIVPREVWLALRQRRHP
ncbi:Putative N-acetylmannosaminyltransferase [Roseivivax sp. THAF40]|uniref:WecB/TagA/CpsF family glycosyltransferase n=1 Tax=unclassified Roseivivax TaxID=2639302 RepID=UPI0012A7BA48|nr:MULTISPECIES: WecB/TagA/CpsF family glycosyltransferase [unclassified Roseivivax]QFS84585.1 Putative N-acetylmannosaminyltransferase [Roseivivax sp. THAF197b]QFT48412.1 Putative N-acetylmannosaminyltransferase [Roseivivax sp. THAF40]